MSLDMLVALSVFCLVSSITPGPNNLMLLSSGINFGLRRSIGHLLGVALGFIAMVILIGLGVSQVFISYPSSYQMLKYLSIAYLIYLAYKIANSATLGDSKDRQAPINFIQAALFQWVNPKAWSMALSVNAVYAPDQSLTSVLLVSAVFFLCNLPSITLWLIAGQRMKRFLSDPLRLRGFNIVMAALLVASFIPMLN